MSSFGYFLIIITKIEKFIGIARAIKLPNNDPLEIESPTITPIPDMASTMEKKAINETFSFKIKYPKIAKNIV